MNRDEAKEILLLYRPGTADAEDPQIEAAMAIARQDPELGRWFNQHVQFQSAIRSKLRQVEVPEHLKVLLLASQKNLPQTPWWSKPRLVWLTAFALVVLVLGVAIRWRGSDGTDQFANFQERMVSTVLRQYAMEWETGDMGRLRQSLASRGGPADYDVPKALEKLKLTGGGVLSWQTNAVSMVCFDRGGGQMLFLFVMKRGALRNPPPAHPPLLSVLHDQMTASWSEGENTYVLAGPEEEDLQTFARKYL